MPHPEGSASLASRGGLIVWSQLRRAGEVAVVVGLPLPPGKGRDFKIQPLEKESSSVPEKKKQQRDEKRNPGLEPTDLEIAGAQHLNRSSRMQDASARVPAPKRSRTQPRRPLHAPRSLQTAAATISMKPLPGIRAKPGAADAKGQPNPLQGHFAPPPPRSCSQPAVQPGRREALLVPSSLAGRLSRTLRPPACPPAC